MRPNLSLPVLITAKPMFGELALHYSSPFSHILTDLPPSHHKRLTNVQKGSSFQQMYYMESLDTLLLFIWVGGCYLRCSEYDRNTSILGKYSSGFKNLPCPLLAMWSQTRLFSEPYL